MTTSVRNGSLTSSASAWRDQPSTPSQHSYLRSLAQRLALFGPEFGPVETAAMMESKIAAGLTRGQASDLIDMSSAGQRFDPAVMMAHDWQIESLRRYATERALFGFAVSPEDTAARVEAAIASGLTQAAASKMMTEAFRAKPYPTAKTPLPLELVDLTGITVYEGHFGIFRDDVLRFYKVFTPETGAMKGVQVIKRYASDNLLALYPDEARAVLMEIDADHDAAAYRFADNFTRCFDPNCGRRLTDAVSRLVSVGPICRGFGDHAGLRAAAQQVDHDPARRHVYRALRAWALDRGYIDPRGKKQREEMTGQMTASRLASAWSGLPGLLASGTPDEVVAAVQDAIEGTLTEQMRAALLAAPADTVLILIESGILSQPVLEALMEHPAEKVRDAASEFFMSLLGSVGL